MEEYLLAASSNRLIPSPPPAPVRTMAEWEQVQALIITWAGQTTILREIVRNAVNECKVLIITTNPANVESTLIGAGISLDSVRFVNEAFNSIWVRDYGPWTVYKNDVDSLWIMDWIYNRPRAEDDATPAAIAAYLDLPIYEATQFPDDWVHTGGNHLPDGMGTLFSSNLVLEENPSKTELQIDSIANKFMGVNQYIKFPTLPFDGIHHLDMHMRLIDEETIIFGQYPEGVADGPQIENNIEYLLDSFKTSFGNDFKIVRLPMPPDNNRYPDQGGDYRTYTNSIFINKTILVPTYEERFDTTALRIYRENLPGYNVVGINCNNIIGSLGALHCITKTVGVADPLLIAHSRLRDVHDSVSLYPLSAYIRHRSGIKSASVFYRTSADMEYASLDMTLQDTAGNIWIADIPSFIAGAEIQYYIHAEANDGKVQVRPIVAPEGYFKFRVYGETVNQPPFVEITYPADGAGFDIIENQIEIVLAANDTDGSVDSVEILINGILESTIVTTPYSYTWTFPSIGTYEIVANAIDDDGLSAKSETITVIIEDLTAITSPNAQALKYYPNPVNDILHIEGSNSISKLFLFNAIGQTIISDRSGFETFDFSRIPSGVYLVHIILDGEWRSFKIVK